MNHPSQLFECHGYFYEYIDATTHKCYGTFAIIPDPKQKMGFDGRKEWLTFGLILDKPSGSKYISFKRPRKIWAVLQMTCGKLKKPINQL